MLQAIAVLVVVLVGGVAFADMNFRARARREARDLFSQIDPAAAPIITAADFAGLPAPVETYLRRCLREGQPRILSARLRQTGQFRPDPQKGWLPAQAEQYFTTQPPGFIWLAKVKMMPLVWIAARDYYLRRRGNMLIRLMSLATIDDARGAALDLGAFIRLLAESMWLPTAFLPGETVRWEAIDARSAKMIATDGELETTLTFYFNDDGDFCEVLSQERHRGTEAQPTPWRGRAWNYQTFDGVRLPVEAEVGWESAETGYEPYYRLSITEIEFNIREPY